MWGHPALPGGPGRLPALLDPPWPREFGRDSNRREKPKVAGAPGVRPPALPVAKTYAGLTRVKNRFSPPTSVGSASLLLLVICLGADDRD
jgi:hypothetical protein